MFVKERVRHLVHWCPGDRLTVHQWCESDWIGRLGFPMLSSLEMSGGPRSDHSLHQRDRGQRGSEMELCIAGEVRWSWNDLEKSMKIMQRFQTKLEGFLSSYLFSFCFSFVLQGFDTLRKSGAWLCFGLLTCTSFWDPGAMRMKKIALSMPLANAHPTSQGAREELPSLSSPCFLYWWFVMGLGLGPELLARWANMVL